MRKINVIIADDHILVRKGFISLLEQSIKTNNSRQINVLDEAGDGRELVEKYFKLKPDIIISDLSMPVLSGIKAFKEIKSVDNKVKALFLSMYSENIYIYQVINSGGQGLVGKDITKDELVFAINEVYEGKTYFGKQWTENKLKNLVKKYKNTNYPEKYLFENDLSERETEIINLIGSGFCSDDIAKRLSISKRTVDTHRTHIIKKMKLKNEYELYKIAMKIVDF